MSSTNDPNRFVLPDNLTQDWLIPYALAAGAIPVGVGDLCYDGTGDVGLPADRLTAAASAALAQAAFAAGFIGVSQQQVLAAETSALKRFVVRTEGVIEIDCPSQTFSKGDRLAVYAYDAGGGSYVCDPQKVTATTDGAAAVAVVVKAYSSATTRVRAYFQARKGNSLALQLLKQRAGAAQAAVPTTAATNTTPYGYSQAQANAIVTLVNEMRDTLIAAGLMKGSA